MEKSFLRSLILFFFVLKVLSLEGQRPPSSTQIYEYDALGNRVSATQQVSTQETRLISFHPPSGLPGDVINILGRNLLKAGANAFSVTIQGKPATVLRVSDQVIGIQVPADVQTGPVIVSVSGGAPIELGTFVIRTDMDRDSDRLPNFVEFMLGLDPDKEDSNNNGVADGDEDFDADHLSNYGEIVMKTSMNNPDTNGDGILDGDHDTDRDDLTDGDEIRLGTDPYNWDTDGDTWPDAMELSEKGDPLDPQIGINLFTVQSSKVLVTVPAVGQANQAPNLKVAQPPVSILLPGPGDSDQYSNNITVAQPPVDILLPGPGDVTQYPGNVTVAQPPVDVLLPGPGDSDNQPSNLTVARPPTKILLPSSGSAQGLNPNMTLAKPPVRIQSEKQSASAKAASKSTRSTASKTKSRINTSKRR